MATDVDRKKLWGRAGSRCSICNSELTRLDGVDSIVGDEAHICGHSEGGPRFNPTMPPDLRDGYDNLILLCKGHHKLVDDNPDIFSPDLLREMKHLHESRVSRALNPSPGPGWVEPPSLVVIHDGAEIVRMVHAAAAYVLVHDQPRQRQTPTSLATCSRMPRTLGTSQTKSAPLAAHRQRWRSRASSMTSRRVTNR
jgi:hypothetical protein